MNKLNTNLVISSNIKVSLLNVLELIKKDITSREKFQLVKEIEAIDKLVDMQELLIKNLINAKTV